MKTKRASVFVVLFFILAPVSVAAQSGDVVLWIPVNTGVTKKDAQIPRNKQYVSVKLHSVYAYYKSGFFENIKQLLVKSDISLEQGGRRVEGTMLNASRELPSKTGEFIGLNDHIAVLTPSSPTSVSLRVGFRGVGEDKFKKIFDVLSGSGLKTPLNLADATIGKINGITSIVQSFLATPYTSGNPKSILDISQSFVLYSDDLEHPDALREGYLVVVSSREKKGGDLTEILTLQPDQIRLSPLGQQLEYKDGEAWKAVVDNSYVIFSITKTTTRGEDESPWLVKYRAAEEASRKVVGGTPINEARDNALAIWREGNILIDADQNYIESERKGIRNAHLAEIKNILGGENTAVNLTGPDIPANFAAIAREYKNELAANASSISVTVTDTHGVSVSNADVVLRDSEKPAEKVEVKTDQAGRATLGGVQPGEYVLETKPANSPVADTQKFVIAPKEAMDIKVRVKPQP
jgi:hypothetical protein